MKQCVDIDVLQQAGSLFNVKVQLKSSRYQKEVPCTLLSPCLQHTLHQAGICGSVCPVIVVLLNRNNSGETQHDE